jgi:hypothetical protein
VSWNGPCQKLSRDQRLAFLGRGTAWGINDLKSVTAPASLAERFIEEISLRRRIEDALLDVQRTSETGEHAAGSEAIAVVDSVEESALELNHELGLQRCALVLPARARKAIEVR